MGTEGNQTLAQYYAECESEGEVRDSYDGMTESGRSEWIYEMMDLYGDDAWGGQNKRGGNPPKFYSPAVSNKKN